jgi:CheY-like chemotaxis protein
MSGLELLPQARAARPDVPIIMITAYGAAETKRKALENGAEALLTKPIDFTTLAMRSTCGLNAPHEHGLWGDGHYGLGRVRQWRWPIWARLPHRRFRMRAEAIAFAMADLLWISYGVFTPALV